MKLKYYQVNPPRQLAGIIRHFWVLEGSEFGDALFSHRTLADCSAELIFYYRGRFNVETKSFGTIKTFSSGLFGQTSLHRQFTTAADFSILGVYFYPFTAQLLGSLAAAESSNEIIEMSALFGREGLLLEEQVMAAENNTLRMKIISDFISRRIARVKNKEPLLQQKIKQILDRPGISSISELTDGIHLSARQFERKFKEFSGFSPKTFLTISRFNSLVKTGAKNQLNLTSLAYDFGYYDQSHFIHDFQKFSGYTPSQYFKRTADCVDQRAAMDFDY